MIFVFIFCLLLAIISLITSKNNIFSPGVITSAVWLVILGLFWFLNHNLPYPGKKFLTAISLWVFVFSFGALLMQSVKFKVTDLKPSQFVRDIFFFASIVSYPFFLLYVRDAFLFGETGNWALDLRYASLGKTSHFKAPYGGWHVLIWNVAYLIEFFYYSKKNRIRVFILAFILLSFGFFTMSKIIFLDLLIKSLCISFFQKKITLKPIFVSVTSILLVFMIIQSARTGLNTKSIEKNDLLVQYILGNPLAFETLQPHSSTHWGENVFRIFYLIGEKTGLSTIKSINPILPFVHKPVPTNTYTILYPFFKDFGYWGIGIFALLLGLPLGWIFKKAQQGSEFFIILYTLFVSAIVIQYGGEMFFTQLPSYMKQILLLLLPFLAIKYNLFKKKSL